MSRVPVRMPKMSMTMTEGELSSWSVTVGDEIRSGDVICEVLTDKVDMEVESPATGVLVEIAVESGVVPVGEPIGWIEAEGDSFTDLLDFGDEAEPAAGGDDLGSELGSDTGDGAGPPAADGRSAEATAASGPESRPAGGSAGPVPAVPRARALAREHGLELASVQPTGPGGVVSVQDVERVLAAAGAVATATAAPSSPLPRQVLSPPQRKRAAARSAAAEPPAVPASTAPPPVAGPPEVVGRFDGRDGGGGGGGKDGGGKAAAVRRAVARKMTESAAVPQFTVWRDLRLDEADRHRAGLSWTTVLLQAYSRALRKVPRLLTRWDGEMAVDTGPPAIALAVDTEDGLLVPVLTEPDTVNPRRLDEEIRAVVRAARSGKVEDRNRAQANASLSNLGGLGADRFQALVTPPQASVLALGSVAPRPVAVPGGLGTALVVTAGLTVDHRVADGADAARLLALLAEDLAG